MQLRGSRSYLVWKRVSHRSLLEASAETPVAWKETFFCLHYRRLLAAVSYPSHLSQDLSSIVASLESFPNYLCLTCRAHHCSVPTHPCNCPAEPGPPLPSTLH